MVEATSMSAAMGMSFSRERTDLRKSLKPLGIPPGISRARNSCLLIADSMRSLSRPSSASFDIVSSRNRPALSVSSSFTPVMPTAKGMREKSALMPLWDEMSSASGDESTAL